MQVESLPEHPLTLRTVRALQTLDGVENAEALFHEADERNAVIGFFMNVSGTGYLLGFDTADESWHRLSAVDEEEETTEYEETTDSVVEWFRDRYGQDGYGVFGIDKE